MLALLAAFSGCDAGNTPSGVDAEACAAPREVVVNGVLSGNLLRLDSEDGEVVRLLGVTAPDPTAECFGPEAREALTELLLGQRVRLVFDAVCADPYGRTLAYVYASAHVELPDGSGVRAETLANAWMIRNGYATVYDEVDDFLRLDELREAEDDAQRAEAGLWSVCR